jgi:ParB-like chromosome segregation protein Spo0J
MPPITFGTSRGTMHPARSPQIEERLDRRHITYAFEPSFPVERVRPAEGNQVRLSDRRAPKHMVARYVEQMRNDAVFPAIVINDADELVDGNTRLAATEQLRRATIAAYVCSDLTPLMARALSVELNQSHGESMNPSEIRAFVIGAVNEGQTLDLRAYARMTGTRPALLKRWIKAEEARCRAARAGLSDRFRLLPEAVQAALQQVRMQSVFVEAVRLAIDAQLNVSTAKTIVREVNMAASEAEALLLIAEARQARAADITTMATGFKPLRRRSMSAAPHLAALMRFEASDLSDVAPERAPDAIARMERLYAQLGLALAQLRQTALMSTGTSGGGAA